MKIATGNSVRMGRIAAKIGSRLPNYSEDKYYFFIVNIYTIN